MGMGSTCMFAVVGEIRVGFSEEAETYKGLNREGLVRGQQGWISGQRTNTTQGRESEMSTACSMPNEESADHSEGEWCETMRLEAS